MGLRGHGEGPGAAPGREDRGPADSSAPSTETTARKSQLVSILLSLTHTRTHAHAVISRSGQSAKSIVMPFNRNGPVNVRVCVLVCFDVGIVMTLHLCESSHQGVIRNLECVSPQLLLPSICVCACVCLRVCVYDFDDV